MTNQEFINIIAPLCQKYAIQYGQKYPSVAIAQACLESAYGTSYKAKYYNFFGLKYRKGRLNCNNGYFTDGGSEQSLNGTYTLLPSNTTWYAFDGYENGVKGYYQFINISTYANLKTASNYLEYLNNIKIDGYATSKNYIKNINNVIVKWGLTKYDNMGINIINKTSTHNTTKKNRTIQYIVIHYTAGVSSKKGSARNISSYFSSTTNQASADFIVDDGEIVQYNPNPKQYYCWSVGGGYQGNKSNSLAGTLYKKCMNNNSISIEMCSSKTNTKSLSVTDNDWYITQATINNAVLLTKYLMNLYGIDINHVIMHNHVNMKWCPQPWTKNENALVGWYSFLNAVKGSTATNTTTTTINTNIMVSKFNITKGNINDYNKIIQNIKLALNKDYGLAFVVNSSVDNILMVNLGNVLLSKTTRNTKPNIVYSLQQMLRWWGYSLTIDGDYYMGTYNVVKTFQKQLGLVQNGQTTKEFWKKLLGYNK